ncbi:hypothetical protein LTR08_008843 [Meristemomyces frigidus]|nr:hypothetical protein LTR08_008843 [Meristemomyces frigidus]
MEMARHEIKDFSSPMSSPQTPAKTSVTDKYAFAFDIDGVLIVAGGCPYIFVTNGGGKTEQERCIQLSNQLEIEVSPGQFICGHTPMREMAEKYDTVLVVGGEGEKCRHVAEGYGFKDVVTPGDISKDNPDTTPFRKLTEAEYESSRARNFSETKIEAIFGGYLGSRSVTINEGPPVFFSHNDVIWSASHDLTRLGMGALRLSLEAMYKAMTGMDLNTTAFGKPQIGTFQFATRLLQQWRKATHGIDAPPETVYFVGDTPESDNRGTNEFNKQSENTWNSILVRTGVFQEGTKPKFQPKATVDNVLEAVLHGTERENKRSLKDELLLT